MERDRILACTWKACFGQGISCIHVRETASLVRVDFQLRREVGGYADKQSIYRREYIQKAGEYLIGNNYECGCCCWD